MGWFYGYASCDAIVDELTRPEESATLQRRSLGHLLTYERDQYELWQAVEAVARTDGAESFLKKKGDRAVYIRCDVINGRDGDWGYKPLDETVGPSYWSCPMRLLNLATEPIGGCAAEWRAEVRAFHGIRVQGKSPRAAAA